MYNYFASFAVVCASVQNTREETDSKLITQLKNRHPCAKISPCFITSRLSYLIFWITTRGIVLFNGVHMTSEHFIMHCQTLDYGLMFADHRQIVIHCIPFESWCIPPSNPPDPTVFGWFTLQLKCVAIACYIPLSVTRRISYSSVWFAHAIGHILYSRGSINTNSIGNSNTIKRTRVLIFENFNHHSIIDFCIIFIWNDDFNCS